MPALQRLLHPARPLRWGTQLGRRLLQNNGCTNRPSIRPAPGRRPSITWADILSPLAVFHSVACCNPYCTLFHKASPSESSTMLVSRSNNATRIERLEWKCSGGVTQIPPSQRVDGGTRMRFRSARAPSADLQRGGCVGRQAAAAEEEWKRRLAELEGAARDSMIKVGEKGSGCRPGVGENQPEDRRMSARVGRMSARGYKDVASGVGRCRQGGDGRMSARGGRVSARVSADASPGLGICQPGVGGCRRQCRLC
jgi:hypothetical protein